MNAIYTKIKDNILLIGVWLLYFFLVCVNMSSPDNLRIVPYDTFNSVVITIFNFVTIMVIIKSFSFIAKSKLIIFSELFLISYYVSIYFNRPDYSKNVIWVPMMIFNAFILARAICNKKENVEKLLITLASVLSFIGLVSIDMASCKFIAAYMGLIIKLFTGLNFMTIKIVETGERIKSIMTNPNMFASFMGVGIFISLYLCEHSKYKKLAVAMLLIDVVSFMYAFSLGATLMLAGAFLIYFIVNMKNSLAKKLFIVLTTGVISVFCVGTGIKGIGVAGFITYVPLISLFVGFVFLLGIFEKEKDILSSKFIKPFIIAVCSVGIIVLVLAFTVIGKVKFTENALEKSLSVRLNSGEYVLKLEFDDALTYDIEVQGQTFEQASSRNFDVLYNENVSGSNVEVPFETMENNRAIKVTIKPEGQVNLLSARLYDKNDSLIKKIKINYLLIPDFVENRLSPFSSNQNALQRFVFFADGLKIWRLNPLIGKGPGAFFIHFRDVQTTQYNTWSSHNFFIDTLCDSGLFGAISLISMILFAIYLVIKNRNNEFILVLGVILIFMVAHSMIEINFIYAPYMITLGLVLGMISSNSDEKLSKGGIDNNFVIILVLSLINVVFNVM